jgi:hypothetical protein
VLGRLNVADTEQVFDDRHKAMAETKKVSTRYRHRFGVEGTKTLQETTLDLLIDGRFLSTTLDEVGASFLRGTRTRRH